MKKVLFSFFIIIVFKSYCFSQNDGKLYRFEDTLNYEFGYLNEKGDTIIPAGKYIFCFSEIIENYGIVFSNELGLIAIDKNENILYLVYMYDNGPDPVSNGMFRIIINDLIGYADAKTGKIIIKPQFKCAWEFENGKAQVTYECDFEMMGEYVIWKNGDWFYINKKGKKIKKKVVDKK